MTCWGHRHGNIGSVLSEDFQTSREVNHEARQLLISPSSKLISVMFMLFLQQQPRRSGPQPPRGEGSLGEGDVFELSPNASVGVEASRGL